MEEVVEIRGLGQTLSLCHQSTPTFCLQKFAGILPTNSRLHLTNQTEQ